MVIFQQPSSSLSCILALHNRISLGHLPANRGSNPNLIRLFFVPLVAKLNTAGGTLVNHYIRYRYMWHCMYNSGEGK
jgi:hypothetical protein